MLNSFGETQNIFALPYHFSKLREHRDLKSFLMEDNNPFILGTQYSVLPIYRGCVYRGIGYIAVACWTPFFGAHECYIFREIAVTPGSLFVGDNFSRNKLTAIAFVLGPRETIFRETNSSLPVNAGWNTCCAVVSHARRSIDTSMSRVQLIQCQCKLWLQIANLGINNAFLIKS